MKKIKTFALSMIGLLLLTLLLSDCQKDTGKHTDSTFSLTSSAVVKGYLLDSFKCEEKINGVEKYMIPLAWSHAPATANSFAITMICYPNPQDSIHFNTYLELWGIDKSVSEIPYPQTGTAQWYMGPNKDSTAISYTSPCSPSAGIHQYIITIYALSATPASLPQHNSMAVTYQVLKNSLQSVNIIDSAKLIFNDLVD